MDIEKRLILVEKQLSKMEKAIRDLNKFIIEREKLDVEGYQLTIDTVEKATTMFVTQFAAEIVNIRTEIIYELTDLKNQLLGTQHTL